MLQKIILILEKIILHFNASIIVSNKYSMYKINDSNESMLQLLLNVKTFDLE